MQFLTEDILSGQYRKAAFTEYYVPENTKLTPGGRQYLIDRKVKIIDPKLDSIFQKKPCRIREEDISTGKSDVISEPMTKETGSIKEQRISYFFRLALTALLEAALKIMAFDLELSQQLFVLEDYIKSVAKNQHPEYFPSRKSGLEKKETEPELTMIHVVSRQGEGLLKLDESIALLGLIDLEVNAEKQKAIKQAIDFLMYAKYKILGG